VKTIGILGLGSIGARHARNLLNMGHKVLGYDPAYTEDWITAAEGKIFNSNRDDLLFESEAVVVASPTPYHGDDFLSCVEAGKHIFVEKPIQGDRLRFGQETLDRQHRRNLIVMVGNNLRFHSCVKKAVEWLEDNLIGRPLWANFTCAQYNMKYEDPVILNWGAHEVDLARHLLGNVTVEASAGGDSMMDIILGYSGVNLIDYSDGGLITVHLDYLTKPEYRGFVIVGTHGHIACNLVDRNIKLTKENDIRFFNGSDSFDANYIEEMQAFIDRIDGKDTIGATGEDGLACLELLLEAKRIAAL
jgi:predicted dehydrogenase